MRAGSRAVSGPANLALPARLDLTTAGALAQQLRSHLGGDLALDAGAVSHLGTPGLQVLLSARKSWAASGHTLTLENAPGPIEEQLSQFGLCLADLVTDAEGGDSDLPTPIGEEATALAAGGGEPPLAGSAAPGESADADADAETVDGETTEEDQP